MRRLKNGAGTFVMSGFSGDMEKVSENVMLSWEAPGVPQADHPQRRCHGPLAGRHDRANHQHSGFQQCTVRKQHRKRRK